MAKIIYENDGGQTIKVEFDEQLILTLHEKGVDLIKELCAALSAEVYAELLSRSKAAHKHKDTK